MRVIHIRADGTVTKSVEGVVITSKEFYKTFNRIVEKRSKAK